MKKFLELDHLLVLLQKNVYLRSIKGFVLVLLIDPDSIAENTYCSKYL